MKHYSSTIALLLFVLFLTNCTRKTSLEGEWYGQRDKSLLMLTLNADSTFNLVSEASSNFTFSGKYVVNTRVAPSTIDMIECSNGMAGAGMLRINEDNTLEMNVNFGAPGSVERAAEINPNPEALTNVYFNPHCS